MFDRVRRSLVIGNVLVIVAIVAILGVGVTTVMDRFLVDQRAADLRSRMSLVVERLRDDPEELSGRAVGPLAGVFAVAWDGAGNVVLNPGGVSTGPLRSSALAASGSGGTDQSVVDLSTGQVVVVSQAVGNGVLQLGEDLGPVRDVERQVMLLLAGAGLIGLCLAVVAGVFLASRAMRPIERAFERQREFTADASHELRTPLAVVDAGLQVLVRHQSDDIAAHEETIGAMREQTARMARLVGGLLTLARADAGAVEIVVAPADVDAIVHGTVVAFGPLAENRGSTVELVVANVGSARVDADRVAELLGILVDNALRHGGVGVHVRVSATRVGRDGQDGVELVVADDGPGIPTAERAKATERFVRGDAARSGDGAGLGLSIARWIAEAHHGRLVLEDAEPGLRARVTLPG
ncbi:MAG TPA: HAMP domain-containing sensor histidine kinase [Candidatus Limnocylindrales bacterium]